MYTHAIAWCSSHFSNCVFHCQLDWFLSALSQFFVFDVLFQFVYPNTSAQFFSFDSLTWSSFLSSHPFTSLFPFYYFLSLPHLLFLILLYCSFSVTFSPFFPPSQLFIYSSPFPYWTLIFFLSWLISFFFFFSSSSAWLFLFVGFFFSILICLVFFSYWRILKCTRMAAPVVLCQLKKMVKGNKSNMETSKKTKPGWMA